MVRQVPSPSTWMEPPFQNERRGVTIHAVLLQHPGRFLVLIPGDGDRLVAAPGVEAPVHPRHSPAALVTTVGPVSRLQQSSLAISTRDVWAGMARASFHKGRHPHKDRGGSPMASATWRKLACAKRPATRQLSGRNGPDHPDGLLVAPHSGGHGEAVGGEWS